jgi:hypothetical protein
VEQLTLTEYDAYWYAHHHDRELPVLRVVFDDDAKTWFHISPLTGDIIGRVDSSRRHVPLAVQCASQIRFSHVGTTLVND